eukprot:m.40830 g.40830  ORF g.40830 m.40830 type:complete len:115 (-) comp12782_c0_seq4:267-611(-)
MTPISSIFQVIYSHAFADYGAMESALAAVQRPILHNVKAPDLTGDQAIQVGQFRRVAKDLKNTWFDMLRVWDTAMDEEYLLHVGKDNFFSDLDSLEVSLCSRQNGLLPAVLYQG